MSAAATRSAVTANMQYCTFELDDNFLGIEVDRVQEILRYQRMTEVPLASSVISGLINLRGRIMTAIDLRRRIGLTPLDEERRPINVVIRREEEYVSLLVDRIGDVMRPPVEQFEPPPDNTDPRFLPLLRGVFKLEDRLLLILDTEKILDLDGYTS